MKKANHKKGNMWIRMNFLPKIAGQSAIEFALTLVVFVPMFFMVPILGKYLDIKQKTVDASRYAAWERTVWSDNNRGWNENSRVSKSDGLIATELDERFYGHPSQGLDNSGQTYNAIWSAVQGGEKKGFLRGAASNSARGDSRLVRASSRVNEESTRISGYTVDKLASRGIADVPSLVSVFSTASSVGVKGCELGLDLEHGIGLALNNHVDISIETPIENLLGNTPLTYTSQSGILSNAWVARNDRELRKRIGQITAAEPVNCVTGPAQILGLASLGRNEPLYGEVLNAYEVEDAVNKKALPINRIGTNRVR